jgi:hypothetical protein
LDARRRFDNCGITFNPKVAGTKGPSFIPLKNWLIIAPNKMKREVIKFGENYVKKMRQLKADIMEPQFCFLERDSTDEYIKALRSAPLNMDLFFIAFLLPRVDKYYIVKKICINELQTPSQCILQNTLKMANQPKRSSIVAKIGFQLNCKLGGKLSAIEIDSKGVMFVGMDIYYNKSADKSVLGFVSSTNSRSTKYYTQVNIVILIFENVNAVNCFRI